ncbi:hypothetical protein HORIV_41400 [Vreelandella olivaria]|uniref:Uncharacterized protein n=1 Tax=Vreelandella olivaria TaxID=390919 RepID=A0ABN5WXN2_9GAMM|nr:hypothetical protein HORIV_41400 [Halomonas olivaria]
MKVSQPHWSSPLKTKAQEFPPELREQVFDMFYSGGDGDRSAMAVASVWPFAVA